MTYVTFLEDTSVFGRAAFTFWFDW